MQDIVKKKPITKKPSPIPKKNNLSQKKFININKKNLPFYIFFLVFFLALINLLFMNNNQSLIQNQKTQSVQYNYTDKLNNHTNHQLNQHQNQEGQILEVESSDQANDQEGFKLKYEEPVIFEPNSASPISGLSCPTNKDRRPIAVMLAADKSVRPLSGVGKADLVLEMPVITNMVIRLMAVYVCHSPSELGSIRSTRHDFLTLAKGWDAILGHWGGSHFALDYLKQPDVADNLNALNNPYNAFYRKAGIQPPDNGFSSYDRLYQAAKKMNYRLTNQFRGYPHRNESALENRGPNGTLTVGFPGIFRVSYEYNRLTNRYYRTWAQRKDKDSINNQRIAPKNIVVMFARSHQIQGQYNDLEIEGRGEANVYLEGHHFPAYWEKPKNNCLIGDQRICLNSDPIRFYKEDGTEIEFIPGQIFIEVLEPGQVLRWQEQG
ncbi:MAG: DUF3048 domain-containing protein [Candidatus Moranbacteria bacterium]|nr:DUF3048 domain-containing protein [Candidatus Moranbacteria bacterium]